MKLALSHVVPDLVLKVLKGQDPLHILGDGSQVRHYTYGGDLARGIRLAMESPDGRQRRLQPLDRRVDDGPRAGRVHLVEDPRPTAARSATSSDPPFEHDVQLRVPDVRKARTSSASRRRPRSRRCSTRSIPWIRRGRGGPAVSGPLVDAGPTEPAAPGLAIVLPVYNEGEAVEPVLRALSARVPTPHETRRRLRLRRGHDGPGHRPTTRRDPRPARPAQRPRSGRPQRDEGRDRRDGGAVRPHLDGRRVGRAPRRRPDGRPGPRRRRRRLGQPLHAAAADQIGGPLAEAADEPSRRPDAPLVRRRPDPRPDEQLQALLATLPRLGDDREHAPASSSPSS